MIVLCTHHKGGVGKTELAIHLTGVLRTRPIERTLLVDCDSQASAWDFYFPDSPPRENETRAVDAHLSITWNPARVRIKSLADGETYDHFVLDIDTPLENAVQTIVQNNPDRVLIPVNPQAGALTELDDPLQIIAQLESKLQQPILVRIVPLGAKLADIRQRLSEINPTIRDCKVAPRVRDLHRQTNRARRGYFYIWQHAGCEDLQTYFQTLLEGLLRK